MAFDYTSGNPDNLAGGSPARMQDIQGPFYDLRTYLNSLPGPSAGGIVVSAPVGDVGQPSQVRAGRQLAVSDFTALGLAAPVGLFNLGDLTNLGSDGRALSNKGTVPFGAGINGNSLSAAVFAGSTGQALYIVDSGATDPFRIRTGSWGCWFRTAKRGTAQFLVSKLNAGATDRQLEIQVDASNVVTVAAAITAATWTPLAGVSDVADDRWHFGLATFDGTTLRVYVDGVLEGTSAIAGAMNGSAGPLNIGGYGADSGPAAVNPHYGRVDEAFVTADILTDDQVRALYAARIVHTLGTTPKSVGLNVRRYRRGAALAAADFTTQPARLHNFTGGVLTDAGSNNQLLTNANPTLILPVAGADGTAGNAFSFGGAHTGLSATDAGLPSALLARSYGCWLKTTVVTSTYTMLGWGTISTGDARLVDSLGSIVAYSAADAITGPFVADGQWHFAVVVEDNAAGDGVRRKLYLDGRLVGGSTVMNSLTLAGANRFRLAAHMDGTNPLPGGQLDAVFVTGYAIQQDEITRLYNKGTQALAASPKNAGDHVEAFDSGSLLFVGDTLDAPNYVDITLV